MTCPTCGAPVDAEASICPTCGAAVRASAPGTPPPSAPAPAPPAGLSSEAKNWAVGAHLSALIGAWVALAFLGPLVVWLIRRDDDPFSAGHAREALNFNLTLLIVIVVGIVLGVPLAIVTAGLALIPIFLIGGLVAVTWLVLTIIATVRASEGREYRYPLTIRLVS